MPPRPCPLPCSDAHEPTDHPLSPPDHQQDPARLRDRRRPRNLMTRTRHCATILTTLIVSTAALTACTRAEAEPPVAQTPSEASPTTAVTSTPGPAKATVKLTEMPEDPETQAALMAYARFEHAMQNMAITGASDESTTEVMELVEPDSDAANWVREIRDQHAEMGARDISGTLNVTYYSVMDEWNDTVQLSLCLDGTRLTQVSGPPLPRYLKSTPAMTKTSSGWVLTYYRTYEADQCP
mgnify:CR=1 FL=1